MMETWSGCVSLSTCTALYIDAFTCLFHLFAVAVKAFAKGYSSSHCITSTICRFPLQGNVMLAVGRARQSSVRRRWRDEQTRPRPGSACAKIRAGRPAALAGSPGRARPAGRPAVPGSAAEASGGLRAEDAIGPGRAGPASAAQWPSRGRLVSASHRASAHSCWYSRRRGRFPVRRRMCRAQQHGVQMGTSDGSGSRWPRPARSVGETLGRTSGSTT